MDIIRSNWLLSINVYFKYYNIYVLLKMYKRETNYRLIHFEATKLRNYATDLDVSFFVVFVIVMARSVRKNIFGKQTRKVGNLEGKKKSGTICHNIFLFARLQLVIIEYSCRPVYYI